MSDNQSAVAVKAEQQLSAVAIQVAKEEYWLRWVEKAFPELDSHTYFLPPVYFNRVPTTTESVAGQDVNVLRRAPGQAGQQCQQSSTPTSPGPPGQAAGTQTSIQDCYVRDDAAMQRVFLCLQKLSEDTPVFFALSNLPFSRNLGEPCYAKAAHQYPVRSNIPKAAQQNSPQGNKLRGDFDFLLIHRNNGFTVCEVKAFGDNVNELKMSEQQINDNIRRKLTESVSQLDKADRVLSHMVSDIAPGLHITKTIAFPNLTSEQIKKVINGNEELATKLSQCLGVTDPTNITDLILCADLLSDPKTPWNISIDVLEKLKGWWQRCVAGSGPDPLMTSDLYKKLVARLGGPAATVTVPCTSAPRMSIKTLGQAVSYTGECYGAQGEGFAQITLYPEQVELINGEQPRVFLSGPPGTGKTVVLQLIAASWLRSGKDVQVMNSWKKSRAASCMMHRLLQKAVGKQTEAATQWGELHLVTQDLNSEEDVDKAVDVFTQAVKDGSLYVIADEAGPDNWDKDKDYFEQFCDKLRSKVPRLHLWAASCFHGSELISDEGWTEFSLTRSLRCPPVVVREVMKTREITTDETVKKYDDRGFPNHTDGPEIKHVYHKGHSGAVRDCLSCGQEVASILASLKRGDIEGAVPTTTSPSSSGSSTPPPTPPILLNKDMLVLYPGEVNTKFDFVKGMAQCGIPVKVTTNDDDINDLATAGSDVVWVANEDDVRSLERKVVVCLKEEDTSPCLHGISRCTSQLVIVSP